MQNQVSKFVTIIAIIFIINCKNDQQNADSNSRENTSNETETFQLLVDKPDSLAVPYGMVWVSGKTFLKGAKDGDRFAMPREKPAHEVAVDGFFIDITEVTNREFRTFVEATTYITVAERPIDWEVMKKDLPANTPKPPDSLLQPGSLIFNKNVNAVANMDNYAQWWTWKIGANWKHPEGPGSSIVGKDDFPVVHIAFEDALAYCQWANRRLPTEAEWESAALGTQNNTIYTWGNNAEALNAHANTWQGTFPTKNESIDGFTFIAPVKSFPANSIGIYDMLGNVWELTSDLYNVNYYNDLETNNQAIVNPKGAERAYSPSNPYQAEHIIKGGSFLCHDSYCASFRISARMGTSEDSGSDHCGFRTVATVDMLQDR